MTPQASIELKGLTLSTNLGTYQAGDVVPDKHILDLILWIDAGLVLIEEDGMDYVFDYDPLVLEINRLASDCHYETQERLITRIVQACCMHQAIQSLDISLRKGPVLNNSGSLGVRLELDAEALQRLRKAAIT